MSMCGFVRLSEHMAKVINTNLMPKNTAANTVVEYIVGKACSPKIQPLVAEIY